MSQTQCWFNLRSVQRDSDDDNTLEGANSPAWSYNTTEGSQETFALSSTVTSGTATSIATTSTGTASATSTASTTASGLIIDSTSSAAGTVTVTAQPTSSPDARGLSTGAKAGIGAGVGCAGLAVIAAAAFLLYRRRRKGTGPDQGYKLDSPTMAMADKALPPTPSKTLAERAQAGPYELSPDRDVHEMPLKQEYYELH
jgi:hypothetical protein